jgi:glyoxylase-like metal-dependent hydrolase (beta-lactamase superfamily II)
VGAPVVGILLSHTHHDHLGATDAMRRATGAKVHAWHDPAAPGFTPDAPMRDGDVAWGWTALHTPGHASDHICFAGNLHGDVIFSADHVMGWSSSVVGPPGGNMRHYFNSLSRLLGRDDAVYLPGHGPAIHDPKPFVQSLLDHRMSRERAILAALSASPQNAHALMELLYSKVDPALKRAAERNVLAHLHKLAEDGLAINHGEGWVLAERG